MPYCPKCDMEFVEGITTCSDCGGPLLESEEAAIALRKQEAQAAKEAAARELEEARIQAEADMEHLDTDGDGRISHDEVEQAANRLKTQVYVKKEQKYEDLKSSASAFLFVGGLLLIASLLMWTGILRLPMAGVSKLIFQVALTVMGIFSVVIYVKSSKEAKALAPLIEQENQATRDLIAWFLDSYDGKAVDAIIEHSDELSPEELSLKRFQVIQDILITNHDLADPAYVDLLSEEIYGKLYEA